MLAKPITLFFTLYVLVGSAHAHEAASHAGYGFWHIFQHFFMWSMTDGWRYELVGLAIVLVAGILAHRRKITDTETEEAR